jgi:formate-dependent phosphoribosylglycinamide formyltransferase (GAR transformylase)
VFYEDFLVRTSDTMVVSGRENRLSELSLELREVIGLPCSSPKNLGIHEYIPRFLCVLCGA